MKKKQILNLEAISSRIIRKLHELDITRTKLAHDSMVSYRLICDITSAVRPVKMTTYGLIADALKVRRDWLINGEGEENKAHLPDLHDRRPNLMREASAAEFGGERTSDTLDGLCSKISRMLGLDEKKVMAAMLKLVAERNGG